MASQLDASDRVPKMSEDLRLSIDSNSCSWEGEDDGDEELASNGTVEGVDESAYLVTGEGSEGGSDDDNEYSMAEMRRNLAAQRAEGGGGGVSPGAGVSFNGEGAGPRRRRRGERR
ncbi:hypothetical protein THAOC_26642, partial [Thalassiosira oceanica]